MENKPKISIITKKDKSLFRTDVIFNMNDSKNTGFHYFASGKTKIESMDNVIREIIKPIIIDLIQNTKS